MNEHLDPGTAARYLAGELTGFEGRVVETHLAGCAVCRELIGGAVQTATEPAAAPVTVLWRAGRFGRSEPGLIAAEDPVAAERREAVLDFLGDLGRTLAVRGEREVDRLLGLSEHERRRAIRAEFERPAEMTEDVAARLLARCRREWTGDLSAAIEAAKLAVLVAQKLTPAEGGEESLEDRLALALQHLAASNRIARRAREIETELERRRLRPAPAPDPDDDAYPVGLPAAFSEVAEDALSVEIEAALDDLRDAGLARGRVHDAALAVLDRARFALDRGGPAALSDLVRTEEARFAALPSAPIPRDAVRYLAAEAERGAADNALIERLARVVLDAAGGFGQPLGK